MCHVDGMVSGTKVDGALRKQQSKIKDETNRQAE